MHAGGHCSVAGRGVQKQLSGDYRLWRTFKRDPEGLSELMRKCPDIAAWLGREQWPAKEGRYAFGVVLRAALAGEVTSLDDASRKPIEFWFGMSNCGKKSAGLIVQKLAKVSNQPVRPPQSDVDALVAKVRAVARRNCISEADVVKALSQIID